jgi:large subunit ribosomal protein L29
MKMEKIRELSEEELKSQERDFSEQLFRLRFQMATGQTEGLAKLRSLKKDIARIQTIRRERQLQPASDGERSK